MKHPRGQGQTKVGLPMHSAEAPSDERSGKKSKCPHLGNRCTDFNQSWHVDAYTIRMRKNHSKKSGRSMRTAPSLAAKTESAHISETAGPILTKVALWVDTPCRSIIVNYQDDQGSQRRVIALRLKVLSLALRWASVKSRCEAPWIEGRSTQLFLFFGRG